MEEILVAEKEKEVYNRLYKKIDKLIDETKGNVLLCLSCNVWYLYYDLKDKYGDKIEIIILPENKVYLDILILILVYNKVFLVESFQNPIDIKELEKIRKYKKEIKIIKV